MSTWSDSVYASSKSFSVKIAATSGPFDVAQAIATGTILNADPAPVFRNNTSGNEGSSLVFSVSKTGATELSHSINYAISNGTATTANSDYTAKSGTLVFAPSDTVKTVSVAANTDVPNEGDERFYVNLTAPTAANGATIGDAQGFGTIRNVNAPPVALNYTVYLQAVETREIDLNDRVSDYNNDPITFSISSRPGFVTDLGGGRVLLTANQENGLITIPYRASDGMDSDGANIRVHVAPLTCGDVLC